MVAPKGARLGALFGVDVDPLMVQSGVGELVDARLFDGEPVAVAEVLSDGILEFGIRVSKTVGMEISYGLVGETCRVLQKARALAAAPVE